MHFKYDWKGPGFGISFCGGGGGEEALGQFQLILLPPPQIQLISPRRTMLYRGHWPSAFRRCRGSMVWVEEVEVEGRPVVEEEVLEGYLWKTRS